MVAMDGILELVAAVVSISGTSKTVDEKGETTGESDSLAPSQN